MGSWLQSHKARRPKGLRNPLRMRRPGRGHRGVKWSSVGIRRMLAWCAWMAGERIACHWCGRDDQRLTVDHVVALGEGGADHPKNCVMACYGCNQRRAGETRERVLAVMERKLVRGTSMKADRKFEEQCREDATLTFALLHRVYLSQDAESRKDVDDLVKLLFEPPPDSDPEQVPSERQMTLNTLEHILVDPIKAAPDEALGKRLHRFLAGAEDKASFKGRMEAGRRVLYMAFDALRELDLGLETLDGGVGTPLEHDDIFFKDKRG